MRLIACVILAAASCAALGQGKEVELKDLQIPNSPGFILLDVAPTSIDRPNSSKAFAASLLNAINSSVNSGVPQNYAAEFAPFWFVRAPKMTALKYWGINEDDKQMPFSAAKLGTLSMAYVKSNDSTTNFSFGLRATLFKVVSTEVKAELKTINDAIITKMSAITTAAIVAGSDPATLAKLVSEDAFIKDAEKKISDLLNRKPVFAVDAAYATSWVFDKNSFSSGHLGRSGVWVTLNYSLNLKDEGAVTKNYINVYAVARSLMDRIPATTDTQSQNSLDLGGRLEFEFDRFSLSYEWLSRENQTTHVSTVRSSGLLRYRVADGIYLTTALGQNFGDVNNLISQFGISWGTGGGLQSVKSN